MSLSSLALHKTFPFRFVLSYRKCTETVKVAKVKWYVLSYPSLNLRNKSFLRARFLSYRTVNTLRTRHFLTLFVCWDDLDEQLNGWNIDFSWKKKNKSSSVIRQSKCRVNAKYERTQCVKFKDNCRIGNKKELKRERKKE